jgi:hypothetical protein
VDALAAFGRRHQREVAQHDAQHHVHLHGRERRAEAAPDAAAERDPLVQVRLGVKEAGRVERRGVREDPLVVMDSGDAHQHRAALRQRPPAEPQAIGLHLPAHEVDDRPGPLHLQDRRLAERAAAGVRLLDQPGQHPGVAAQPLHGPGERGGRGLVPGGQQGEQLVRDLAVAHRRSVGVAALQHEREDVVALVQATVFAGTVPPGDEPLDDRVVLTAHGPEPGPRVPSAPAGLRDRQRRQPRAERDQRRQQPAQLGELIALDAENGSQDRVEGDAHHGRQHRELLALRPRGQLALGLFLDDRLVGGEPSAVERGNEQPALLAVFLAGEREQRAGPEDPPEVALEVVRYVRAGQEQLLDLGRVADDDGAAEDGNVDGERVTVARAQPAHRAPGQGQRAGALHQARGGRTRRERHGRHGHLPDVVRNRTVTPRYVGVP